MTLGAYISSLEGVMDLDLQSDLSEERRQLDLAWQREQARWLAANALPIATDGGLDEDFRCGYARSALERIAAFAPAFAPREVVAG